MYYFPSKKVNVLFQGSTWYYMYVITVTNMTWQIDNLSNNKMDGGSNLAGLPPLTFYKKAHLSLFKSILNWSVIL